jgi:hypothetical protein
MVVPESVVSRLVQHSKTRELAPWRISSRALMAEQQEKEDVAFTRWMTFAGCLYVVTSCGLSTTFGLFTPSFEETLHLRPR